jgi:hypothetical protein
MVRNSTCSAAARSGWLLMACSVKVPSGPRNPTRGRGLEVSTSPGYALGEPASPALPETELRNRADGPGHTYPLGHGFSDAELLRRCNGRRSEQLGPARSFTVMGGDPDVQIVRALRRQRRRRRVADLEWFEVLYRVYLVALGGGSLALWLSSFVRDRPLDSAGLADVVERGPAIIGCVAAIAIALGARSGTRGGPIAVEEADVRHVLLAPISRAAALRSPAWQRIRSVAFSGMLGGAVAGQLIGRRMPGSIYSWALSGAGFGLAVGLLYVGVALFTHITRWKSWQATAGAVVVLAIQGAAAGKVLPFGLCDSFGSLAIWPIRVHWLDLVAVGVAAAVAAFGWVRIDRLSVEQLARRSGLVSQLRFAATMQDLRTVVLLRRQLSLEHARQRPWFTAPRFGGIAMHRGLQSIARFPLSRIGRIGTLAIAAGVLNVVAYRGWTPAAILAGLAWFLVGLETIEPFSQELDHPERTELLPVDVGALHHRLLLPSALLIALIGLAGGLVGGLVEATRSDLGTSVLAGLLLGPPAALFGGLGAVFNASAGAPDLSAPIKNGGMMPPEVAGISTMMSVGFPPFVATVGSLPILLVRKTVEIGGHPLATALRSAIALGVLLTIGAWWIRSKPAFKAWWARTQEDAANRSKRPAGGSQ